MSVILESIITCPECGFGREETMPTDQCLLIYTCRECGKSMHAKRGECCVFCAYGSIKCPSKQD